MEKELKTNTLVNFVEFNYEELEKRNLALLKNWQTKSDVIIEEEYRQTLEAEKGIKAVTLCFSDIEGRFHMLDYDKVFFLASSQNLTFDGSSIRGLSDLGESDLRLRPDWPTMRFAPTDIFGAGKVVMFADILDRQHNPYPTDFRTQLKLLANELKAKKGIVPNASAEVEGFLVDGQSAEQKYIEEQGFKLISSGGYYHSLPLDKLRLFIDKAAKVQRAMAFKNEKDHPEVAPSQFELNFSYMSAVRAADNIQLYKLICRQVAETMGMTATFLPKPIANINGNGMHINFSFEKNGTNIFYDKNGKEGLSKEAWNIISRILNHAPEVCLIFNSSVNAYRRLDPNFEAPNQIKVSLRDRGAMIRIPVGNEKTARIEIRSVAPDANPYLVLLVLIKIGLNGEPIEKDESKRDRVRFLPGTIADAIRLFKTSEFVGNIIGEEAKTKFMFFKQIVCDRSPKELGTLVKKGEILYHHEVTNQVLWSQF